MTIGMYSGFVYKLQLLDYGTTNRFANPTRPPLTDLHVACPFAPCPSTDGGCYNYMTPETVDALAPLVEAGGESLQNLCPTFPDEAIGTALGSWYSSKDQPGSHPPTMPVAPLWLTHDPSTRGEQAIIGNDTALADAIPLPNVPGGNFGFYLMPSSGRENVDFGDVTYGPDDGAGPVYCYDQLFPLPGPSTTFVMLLQMLSPTTLQVEAAQTDHNLCSDLSPDGGSEGWAFPGQNLVTLER